MHEREGGASTYVRYLIELMRLIGGEIYFIGGLMDGGSRRREIMTGTAQLRYVTDVPGVVYTVLPPVYTAPALISTGIDKWILVILRSIYGVSD